jgi:hypothetical protein
MMISNSTSAATAFSARAAAAGTNRYAAALQILDVEAGASSNTTGIFDSNGISLGLGKALESVTGELDFAQQMIRREPGVIDGSAREPLSNAIRANRAKFPPGEFTISFKWADGASVSKTFPAMELASTTLVSIDIASISREGRQSATTIVSAQMLYAEWH